MVGVVEVLEGAAWAATEDWRDLCEVSSDELVRAYGLKGAVGVVPHKRQQQRDAVLDAPVQVVVELVVTVCRCRFVIVANEAWAADGHFGRPITALDGDQFGALHRS